MPDSVKELRRKGPDGPGPGQYDPGAWQVGFVLTGLFAGTNILLRVFMDCADPEASQAAEEG